MRYRYRSDDELKDSGVEWLGKIPKDWELRQLKRVLADRKENNEPIKTSNILSLTIEKGVIPYSEKGTGGNKAKEDLRQYKLVYPNDIVLNSMNVIVGAVGLSKYFGCASPAYYMLYKINESDDIRFYNYIFKSKLFQDSLKGLGNGIMMKQSETSGKLNTIRMRIPMEKLSSVKMPIIFSLEQEKIANFLDEKTSQFDLIISKKEKLIERLEEAKKSLISEVVTGKVKVVKTNDGYELIKRSSEEMKDSGVEWLGKIPKDWEVKKIKHVALLKSGDSITSEKIEEEGQYPVYGGNGLRGYTGSYTHEGKYILIGRQGALCGNINYANDKFWASEHAVVVNPIITVDLIWLGELLRSMNLNQYSVSAAQPGLAVGMIQNLYIPYTNIENQINITKYISEKIKNIDTTMDKTKLQIEKLKEAKQSLISEAVTGKIEILD